MKSILALAILVSASAAFAQVPGKTNLNIVHPLPPHAPAWLPGYQVRWPVRVIGQPSKQDGQSVLVRIPTNGWLKADASDLTAQTAKGTVLPLVVLSHDPLGDTIVQFKRDGDEPWYWVYGVNPKGPPAPRTDAKAEPALREGVTLELRDWAGTDLTSWAKVRPGLEKSEQILGNAIVADVIQTCNPARPHQNNKFASSYRGYFSVKKEGAYRFLVNSEDAAFLFIDGFKVFERTGNNNILGAVKVKELDMLAGKVDLKPGVHSFEVHQVVSARADATGRCTLVWSPFDQPKFTFLPAAAIAHPLYGRVAAMESPQGEMPGGFEHGLDDMLEAGGLRLFLVRFEAQGPIADPKKVTWDFGDGTTGTGRSVTHVYFKEDDFLVTVNPGGGLPPAKRRISVWAEPGETSPLSLDLAVDALTTMEWRKLDATRLREVFAFLQVCESPKRWPLLEELSKHLLAQKDLDLEFRSQLIAARLKALTSLTRAAEALKLAEEVKGDFLKTPALQVRIQLGVAAIHQYHYKDAAAASKIYKAILDEHSRTEHPNLRVAAIRWGDLFAEAGDLARASDTYRIAATLGGEKFTGAGVGDAATRGALLRIAEQKLKAGDFHATRQLLEKMELEYPGRRLDGLYCFLRAEADRFAGRYDESLRHYEMIFKLPQWAGYKDRATFGIADCQVRMGQLDKALKWYGDLKENFPKLHEERKVADIEKLISLRLERLKPSKADESPEKAFEGFVTGFEPEETEWFGEAKDFAIVRGPGLFGPHVGLYDAHPKEMAAFSYNRRLRNLVPGTLYWVEVWYRDIVKPSPPGGYQYAIQVTPAGEFPLKTSELLGHAKPRNSHHQWHKASFKFRAPLTLDFLVYMNSLNNSGGHYIDGFSVRPVSDRQWHALVTFQEGAKGP